MCNAKLSKRITVDNSITYEVSKKDFELKKVEIVIKNIDGVATEVRPVLKDRHNEWTFSISKEELLSEIEVTLTNGANRVTLFDL